MITPGLVSVSFRQLSPEEIVRLCAECGLHSIEWGGDVHVPLGDIVQAKRVGRITRENGMQVACYGSYCNMLARERPLLESLVETAHTLGTLLIRVWAGITGSAKATLQQQMEVACELRALAEMAEKAGMGIALEYHNGTLTDTAESTCALLMKADHPCVGTLWQPPIGKKQEDCLRELRQLSGHLRNIHAYTWAGTDRQPLEKGEDAWRRYLRAATAVPGDRCCLLEFVRNDDPTQLLQDARCLNGWLKELNA